MRKIILKNYQSPGDIMMLTAAVRDLKIAHPEKFEIKVDTSCGALWENNPYISDFPNSEADDLIKADYPLIHKSNDSPYHFIHGFRKHLQQALDVHIPMGKFRGDIHVSSSEKSWYSQVEELGYKGKFWILMAGGKFDFTAKWWNPNFYQKVVDHFKGKIVFVQCGEKTHFHPPLKGVINLIGKTDMRQYVRLMYHSIGCVSPVTFGMHLCAAVESRHGLQNRPGVVLAGGREPAQWEQYPHHQFLSNNGALDCCDNGGCWKSRCTKVGDGDNKDNHDLCVYPVKTDVKQKLFKDDREEREVFIAKCMNMISASDVIRAIETYYEGGMLKYEKHSDEQQKILDKILTK
jgi:ADP-heptose:LPS heptosyltransferase